MKKVKINDNITIIKGDCLGVMKELSEQGVKADLVLTDPPYGTTACKWDFVIPFNEMWDGINDLVSDSDPIVLFSSQPFTTTLIHSNIKNYKHSWVWDKVKQGAFANAKYSPLRQHEDINVFSKNGGRVKYNPQMTPQPKRKGKIYSESRSANLTNYDGLEREYTEKYPKTILTFSNAKQKGKIHPTQKPVELLEYLIRTYSDEGGLVLDFTAGSFSTAIACINTNRKFIGIELEDDYFEAGRSRILDHLANFQN